MTNSVNAHKIRKFNFSFLESQYAFRIWLFDQILNSFNDLIQFWVYEKWIRSESRVFYPLQEFEKLYVRVKCHLPCWSLQYCLLYLSFVLLNAGSPRRAKHSSVINRAKGVCSTPLGPPLKKGFIRDRCRRNNFQPWLHLFLNRWTEKKDQHVRQHFEGAV